MGKIRGNRPNRGKKYPGGVRAPSVVRGLESASATGTWRHVYGDVFNFLWGSKWFFLMGI